MSLEQLARNAEMYESNAFFAELSKLFPELEYVEKNTSVGKKQAKKMLGICLTNVFDNRKEII